MPLASRIRELIAQILASPDDLAPRLVLADALTRDGDPRGELIHLQVALTTADGEERVRLEAAIAPLVARLAPRDPGVEVTWKLGFIDTVTIAADAVLRLEQLLADPAARLLRVASVAVEPPAIGALCEVIAGRPRPSLLERLEVGRVVEGSGWIGRPEEGWIDPIRTALPDDQVAVVRFDRISQAEFEATIGADESEYRNELYMEQIAPVIEMWPYHVELVIRAGHDAAVDEIYGEMPDAVEWLLTRTGDRITFYQAADRTYAGYGNIHRTLRALAPHVEDVRFVVGEWDEDWIDEYAVEAGRLAFARRDRAGDYYWSRRVAEQPDDHVLRAYAVRERLHSVERSFEQLDRQTGAKRRATVRQIQAVLDAVAALDDRAAALWRARGRLARAIGDHAASDRAFARSAELEQMPGIAFDRALVALAARDHAAAATLIERAVTEEPERTVARLVASFVTDPGRSELHLGALLATIDDRRRRLTKLDEAQRGAPWPGLEPDQEDLVRTGRHAELVDRFVDAARSAVERDPTLREAAAAYALVWAEISRIHVAHGRNKRDAAKLARRWYAAAAELEPLAGSVHYYWSLFDGRRKKSLLETALEHGPDHLCTLGHLGAAARKAGDLDRAVELLERYVRGFRALHTGGVWGLYWDFHLAELAISHYERACLALHGVRPGVNPAGRPSPEALDRAEAMLAPALELYDSLSRAQQRAGGGVFQLRSSIAEYRGDHQTALAWAERALATDDNSPYFWSTKGGCLDNLGRGDEAIACCEKALALDADHWHAHLTIASAMTKRDGDRDEIYRRLRRVATLWPEGRSEISSEPSFAALRDEPRFRKLFGAPAKTSRRR